MNASLVKVVTVHAATMATVVHAAMETVVRVVTMATVVLAAKTVNKGIFHTIHKKSCAIRHSFFCFFRSIFFEDSCFQIVLKGGFVTFADSNLRTVAKAEVQSVDFLYFIHVYDV